MGQTTQFCPLDQSPRAKDPRVGLAGGLWTSAALDSLIRYATASATATATMADRDGESDPYRRLPLTRGEGAACRHRERRCPPLRVCARPRNTKKRRDGSLPYPLLAWRSDRSWSWPGADGALATALRCGLRSLPSASSNSMAPRFDRCNGEGSGGRASPGPSRLVQAGVGGSGLR